MKVGHKTRRGRKRKPVPHKDHRTGHAIGDPVTRAQKRIRLDRVRRDAERVERAAW